MPSKIAYPSPRSSPIQSEMDPGSETGGDARVLLL
jgi:hypothetical protein